MNEHEKPQIDFMHKLARQIVERRNLVFLFVILAAIFTVFSVRWVKVETDMTTYLPKTSETRMGLDIMDEQFTTYGSADVMVANITPAEADELSDRLTELKGVQMLDYDDTTDHYNKDAVSALYSITFDYPEDDDQCLEALDRVKEYLADYDIYVSTSLGNTQQETIDAEDRRAGAGLGQRLVLVEAVEQHLGRDVDVVQMVAPAKLNMEREAANLVALPLLRRQIARAVRADDDVRHGHSLQRG